MLRRLVLPLLLACAFPVCAETVSRTLPNGLKVVVKEDRRAPVAVSQIWYKVGSVDEQPGKTGLSHALEHMMFKGTAAVPSGEFSRLISAWGGQLNAYTNRNETVYYENIAAANLPKVLELEADRMQNLNFSDAEFLNEMNVIREERRQRTDDSAGGKLWEHVFINTFENPALRAPVIGYMADLDKLKADDLREWYRQWYAPNNAVLVVVGDVDAQETVKKAEALFGRIAVKPLPNRNNLAERQQRQAVVASTDSAVTRQPLSALSFRVPGLNPERLDERMPYALSVLASVLGGHSSSRFDAGLVRGRKVALSAGAGYDMMSRELPLFHIFVMPSEGKTVEEVLALVRAEIADIAANGISQAELQRVRNRITAEKVYAQDSMTEQASVIGRLETHGFRYQDEDEIRRRLLAVSAEEVRAAAALLTADRSSQVTVYPAKAAAK